MKQLEDVEREYWLQAMRKRSVAKRPLMPVYRVGEPLRRGRRHWPPGGRLNSSQGGIELTIFHPNISEAIVSEVRKGEVELALVVELPLIVFAYRFGEAIPWDDIPYSWHLQPAGWRMVPSVDPSPEARALLWITLVERQRRDHSGPERRDAGAGVYPVASPGHSGTGDAAV